MQTKPTARTRRQAVALVRFHEYEGQVWFRETHDIRVRSTMQRDAGKFPDLPWIGDVAEAYGWQAWTVDELLDGRYVDVDDDEIELVDEFDVEPEQDEPSIYFNPDDEQ